MTISFKDEGVKDSCGESAYGGKIPTLIAQ